MHFEESDEEKMFREMVREFDQPLRLRFGQAIQLDNVPHRDGANHQEHGLARRADNFHEFY